MSAIATELEDHAREQIRFFSNAGKKDREKWVVEAWCRLTGRTACSIAEGERPDFVVGLEQVEISEILHPEPRRQDAVRKDAAEIAMGRFPQPRDAGSLDEVLAEGHLWVLNGVSAKTQKYRSIPTSNWILLLYVNVSFWKRIRWELVESQLILASPPFRQIEVLGADGNAVITVFPRLKLPGEFLT